MTDEITIPAGELCWKHIGWEFKQKGAGFATIQRVINVSHAVDTIHLEEGVKWRTSFNPTELVTLRKPEASHE